MKLIKHVISTSMLLAGTFYFSLSAASHPHVWIEAKSGVIFDEQGLITAISHQWTMDEMYTEAAIDGLDKDGDGTYSPSELEPLTKENIESLKEYSYFTSLKAGGENIAFGDVVDSGQIWSNKRLELNFKLPLKQPIDPKKVRVFYRVYDPGFFIAIEFPGKDSVAAAGNIPGECKVELQEIASDQQTEETRLMLSNKGLDWQAPPEEDFGGMFAQPIAVVCGGTPAPVAASQPPDLSGRALVGAGRTSKTSGTVTVPPFWSDPAAFVLATQQSYYERISGALSSLRSAPSLAAAWSLMLLSFGYGVFHAAGPGHGKTVISGWLLATEQQLKRGILISFSSAIIQALSAILIVSILLFLVQAVGSTAKSVAAVLETASYGMIALLGFYLLWRALDVFWPAKTRSAPRKPLRVAHDHDHSHVHSSACGHNHIPHADSIVSDWSLTKAMSVSLAVGIRPCTGAILALLFANTIGLYWAGVAATFIMAIGTALTVSAIAILAVLSKRSTMVFIRKKQAWLDWMAFGLQLGGGILIAFLGATLFIGSLNGVSTPG